MKTVSPKDYSTTLHVVCECTAPEHIVQFAQFEPEDGKPEECCFVSVQLSPYHPWYKRVRLAVRYVMGLREKCGHWDCTLMGRAEAEKLYVFLGKFLNKE